MNCSCGGVLLDGKSTYRVSEDDFCFILDNIPAFQCQRCKKVLFQDDTVEKIEALIKKIKKGSNDVVGKAPSVNLRDYD